MGVSRKNRNVGEEVIGDPNQGLKADCPSALFWPERCLERKRRKRRERREDHDSECFQKRCVPFSSGPTTSSCPRPEPTHTIVFLPGTASEFATLECPCFTDEAQLRGRVEEGPAPGGEQAVSAEPGPTRQAC